MLYVSVRVSSNEKRRYKELAERFGLSLSALIRKALNNLDEKNTITIEGKKKG